MTNEKDCNPVFRIRYYGYNLQNLDNIEAINN